MNKIAAVVVTYNRCDCLKKVIDSLRKQSRPIDTIIVINNGSSDGTSSWLKEQKDILVVNQENIGGSGGFYTGVKTAFEKGYDYLWCMDDDVYPREDCLEKLLKEMKDGVGITCPKRIQKNKVFITESITLNLANPCRRLFCNKLYLKHVKEEPISIEGMVFEGPLIKREVVEKLGMPNKDYFIIFDDFDYSYRACLAGFICLYIPDAVLDKEYFFSNMSKKQIARKDKWKQLYRVRNYCYFNHHFGKGYIIRNIRPFIYFLYRYTEYLFFGRDFSVSSLRDFHGAYKDGVHELLGKR